MPTPTPRPHVAADPLAADPLVADPLATDPLVLAQDGVATVHQLMDLGCASSTIPARCRPPAGPWRRLLPRVIVLQTTTPTPRQRLRGALLYAGPDALLTGPAVLALHEVESAPPLAALPKVDVLVTHRAPLRGHAYVRVHPTMRRAPRTPVQGLPCAPLARAVSDAIPHLDSGEAVTRLLAEVAQRALCRPEELLGELDAGHLVGDPCVMAAVRAMTW
ncbi:hypothetical protein [Streptomyces sp. NPDC006368]|uniref:hypothetical protein n=1 Tax=Streptomyces sp. NPDC006368 TaxID=3156760 RepID=UPI0033B85BCA